MLEIHFDPLGGWSGDMFAAALLDAFPEHRSAVETAVGSLKLGLGAAFALTPFKDRAGLTGLRFKVAAEPAADAHSHGDHHHHEHRSWASIRALIETSALDSSVQSEAIAIFALLAEAEGEVHGVSADSVRFHEVGAVDSIVDIVAAAQLIVLADARRWTSAPLPLGSGRVRTAHGVLPVPAPATALLLRGLDTIDDGVPGERVTPTGAAIARRLLFPKRPLDRHPRALLQTGTGFGSRELPGISNCLRALVFDSHDAPAGSEFAHRELAVIAFEVDDQSSEDLAAGLEHLRALEGVHDVIQSAVLGKKGRLATQVQALVAPERLDAAIARCFAETTTIGLRFHIVHGAALPRSFATVSVAGRDLRTKTVVRPSGARTAKAEVADVASERGYEARMRLRREAEEKTLGDHEGKAK